MWIKMSLPRLRLKWTDMFLYIILILGLNIYEIVSVLLYQWSSPISCGSYLDVDFVDDIGVDPNQRYDNNNKRTVPSEIKCYHV